MEIQRFLNYVKFDTQSNPNSTTHPSTDKQFKLGQYLVNELHSIGVENAYLDENGYVYGYIPSNSNCTTTIGLIAHMDTSPDCSGFHVNPRIIENYDGKDIILNKELNFILSSTEFSSLKKKIGHTLITTDGTTLLGADDKSGICIIVSAVERIMKEHIRHPNLIITFTPDEEIGEGTTNFNYSYYREKNCHIAYTLDGGDIAYLSFENFNAASCKITIRGKSIHPGSAKGKMVNSISIASEIIGLFPKSEVPELTENREGFFHLTDINGNVEKTTLSYIIRNHDTHLFQKQKEFVQKIVNFINDKYGSSTATIDLKDSYYNMRDLVLKEPEILEYAIKALKRNHIDPEFEAIRGGTDGARLSFEGILTPNLGTGGKNFHGPYEYLDATDMMKMIDVIISLVELIVEEKN